MTAVELAGVADEAAFRACVGEALKMPLEEAGDRLVALRVTLSGATPLHRRLKADTPRFRDDVQALADHQREDVWLERLRIETSEPPHSRPLVPEGIALDPAALLEGLENDPALRARAATLMEQILAKIPGAIEDRDVLTGDLDALFADARVLAIGRAVDGNG
jgi:exonuclease SbcD